MFDDNLSAATSRDAGFIFLLERANLHQLEGGIGRDYSVSILQPLSLSLSLFVGIFVALKSTIRCDYQTILMEKIPLRHKRSTVV